MSGVLYKWSPPPEPEEDPYPRSPSPTSPSREDPEDETLADYVPDKPVLDKPDEPGLNARFQDHDDRKTRPTFLVADDFDSLYSDVEVFSKEDMERQTNQFARAALDHYNRQEKNVIKYELIKAITSAAMMDVRRRVCFYGHVNFTAKSTLENSKEEFFFAELCHDHGGVRDIKGNDGYYGKEIRVDTQYCYACDEELKHPEDGTLYESGHQVDDEYGYLCS